MKNTKWKMPISFDKGFATIQKAVQVAEFLNSHKSFDSSLEPELDKIINQATTKLMNLVREKAAQIK